MNQTLVILQEELRTISGKIAMLVEQDKVVLRSSRSKKKVRKKAEKQLVEMSEFQERFNWIFS